MVEFKYRIIFTILGLIFSILLFYIGGFATAKLIPDSAGLAGLVYVLVFVGLSFRILPALIIIFFFIGYRKDIAKLKIKQQTPWLIQLMGLLGGFFLGAYCNYLFTTWLPFVIDRFSSLAATFSLYSGPVFILIYAIFGFIIVQFFYFLFHFHSKKYLVQFLVLFIFIVPFSLMLFINHKNYQDKLLLADSQSMSNTSNNSGMRIKKIMLSNVEIVPDPKFPSSPIRRMPITVTLYSPVNIQARLYANLGSLLGSAQPENATNGIYQIKKGEQQIVFIFRSQSCKQAQYQQPEETIARAEEFEIIGHFEPSGGNFPTLKTQSPPFRYADLVPACSY